MQQMPEIDPRRPIVEVMAKLGRETQLHMDEREHHFQVTDSVIIGISLVLIVLAVFNVYYVRVLYNDMDRIVVTMESMHANLKQVDVDMGKVADRVESFDRHIAYMGPITNHVVRVTAQLPAMEKNMQNMAENMGMIEKDMIELNHAVNTLNPSMTQITNNVHHMRRNVRQISRPMGALNPVLP